MRFALTEDARHPRSLREAIVVPVVPVASKKAAFRKKAPDGEFSVDRDSRLPTICGDPETHYEGGAIGCKAFRKHPLNPGAAAGCEDADGHALDLGPDLYGPAKMACHYPLGLGGGKRRIE